LGISGHWNEGSNREADKHKQTNKKWQKKTEGGNKLYKTCEKVKRKLTRHREQLHEKYRLLKCCAILSGLYFLRRQNVIPVLHKRWMQSVFLFLQNSVHFYHAARRRIQQGVSCHWRVDLDTDITYLHLIMVIQGSAQLSTIRLQLSTTQYT
jgi:hypothetical protein